MGRAATSPGHKKTLTCARDPHKAPSAVRGCRGTGACSLFIQPSLHCSTLAKDRLARTPTAPKEKQDSAWSHPNHTLCLSGLWLDHVT